SDEILYPGRTEEKVYLEIQSLFDGLNDALRSRFINDAAAKNPLPSKAFDIQVSYCRYCKTGYCFGKERKVVIEFVEGGAVVKTFELNGLLLRDKARQKDLIKRITGSIGN
ncbi:MAG: hypothetical protein ACRCUT_14575, partial [Spirochaetota bacterium]